jgi:hypothetical protein
MGQALIITCRHCTATKDSDIALMSWTCWKCVALKVDPGVRFVTTTAPTPKTEAVEVPVQAAPSDRACEWCGGSLLGRRAGARFCSPACRKAGSRAGQADVTLSADPHPQPAVTDRRRVAAPEGQGNTPIEAMETQDG